MRERPAKRGGPLYWLGQRSWRFWVAAGLLLPLLYVASLGPFAWMASRHYVPRWVCDGAQYVYSPLDWIWRNGPEPVGNAIVRYERLWITSAYVNPPRRQNPSMALCLSIFAVAFAAFCIWLTVRIVNRRERWAKWMLAAVVGVPVLYVLSFGPACWIVARTHGWQVPHIYLPFDYLLQRNDGVVCDATVWYGGIGMPEYGFVFLPQHTRRYRTVINAGERSPWRNILYANPRQSST